MPTPKAAVINLSQAQAQCLKSLAAQTTNPYRLVRRENLILGAAAGATNSQLSQDWKIDRNQVRSRAWSYPSQSRLRKRPAQEALNLSPFN